MKEIRDSDDLKRAQELLNEWGETLILSALQGIMGKVYLSEDGNTASVYLGDFGFVAGKPSREAVLQDTGRNFVILVPKTDDWCTMIEEALGEKCRKATRYAIRKDTEFDRDRLESLRAKLPEGYEMGLMTESDYRFAKLTPWARDWVSQFADWEEYRSRGLGMIVRKGGIPVSGASSYSVYEGGIEIEIQTEASHRRQGLATAAAAGLILECLDRGLYPSWDASNLWSVGLAQKLGYVYDGPYTAYFVSR